MRTLLKCYNLFIADKYNYIIYCIQIIIHKKVYTCFPTSDETFYCLAIFYMYLHTLFVQFTQSHTFYVLHLVLGKYVSSGLCYLSAASSYMAFRPPRSFILSSKCGCNASLTRSYQTATFGLLLN